MTQYVPIAMSPQEARDEVASQGQEIERLKIMVKTRDQIICRLQLRLSQMEKQNDH